MSTPTIDRPTVETLRRIVGTHQAQAPNSYEMPTYVRWYTGIRQDPGVHDVHDVHAVATWRAGNSGMIEALCGRADPFWGETSRARTGNYRCPACAQRAAAAPKVPNPDQLPRRPYIAKVRGTRPSTTR